MAKSISISKQLRFLESLNSLLQNGFSIGESMQLINDLDTQTVFTEQILKQLQNGETFADAVQEVFSTDIINQIQIAEQHGQLVETMRGIQGFINERNKQQGKLRALLVYPFFLIGLLMVILVGIKLFVTPQLSMIGDQAPASNSFNWGWFLLPPLMLVVAALGWWLKQQPRIKKAELFARVPLIGPIIRAYYAYFFASNVSLLLASGLEARSIAELMKRFPPNSIFYEVGLELQETIEAGVPVSQIIKQHAFLPDEAALFFDHGDRIQVLAKKLTAYAKLSFDRMWTQSQRLISIVQPIIFVLIGGLIVITYLNMLLPMYDTLSEVYN
ncbi:competence type IV pilus assembly protein ComGB [Lactobacillus sp. Sy-1]|uniref:competence type IV pilus assembly protein ComGB n=1 Tax=Lactobacillus sp. Sy-1 TaxID=2109645 RepID=UPI001C579199|nr:competence type IV pilus assembly protein ComGB [Lactobacillus sp. Sy-1]MBW1605767.1 type II secretion system F family protein [Lactobacillus sp. Sy-1]